MKSYIFFLMALFFSQSYADSVFISHPSLSSQLNNISGKIDRIHTRGSEAKNISIEFKKIAKEHYNLISEHLSFKSKCKNIEARYNSYDYSDSYGIKGRYRKRLVNCRKKISSFDGDYKVVTQSFIQLEKKISSLMNMSNIDMSDLDSLKQELNVIDSMLKLNKMME